MANITTRIGVGPTHLTIGWYGGGPGPTWSPAALFANGEKGAWYDPSDLTTMFQDTAGTVPVTAHGDPVRRINDKSGNGYHWIAPSDAARPVYQTDGTYHWLDFNGSTHTLGVAISGFGRQMDIVSTIRPNSGKTQFFAYYEAATVANDFIGWATTGVNVTFTPASASPSVPWVDGSRIAGNITNSLQSAIGTAVARLYETRCCDLTSWAAFNFGTWQAGYQFAGRLYGLIIAPYMHHSVRTQTQDWTAAKAPISTLPDRPRVPVVAAMGDSTVATYNGQREVTSYIAEIDDLVFAVPAQTIAQQRARWNAMSDRSQFDSVVIQVGLNDLAPGESAATALARLQAFVDDVVALRPANCPLLIGQMTPCRQRLINIYGGTGGPVAYQKWLDMNDAIAGIGPNAITGADGRITAHVSLLDDGSGNLAPAYDTGDGIHENNAGRQIIAEAWEDALVAAGVL